MASIILPANPSESRPGRFGVYGGRYVPETLMAALVELEREYEIAKADAAFQAELTSLLTDYAGRPTPLYFCKRLTEQLGGAKIYLKREDLLHTGAHKINNALGQGLLAKRMGKKRVIAETGAGQHGVATATVCALLGLECVVYMGDVDMARQELNVLRMRLLGAEVRGVSLRLEDAERRHQRGHARLGHQRPHHLLSARQRSRRASLPHHGARLPARHRQGDQSSRFSKKKAGCPRPSSPAWAAGRTPSACSMNSSADRQVRLIGVEAGGCGTALGQHAARFRGGAPGVLQGTYSYVLQDEDGQIALTHSVSAGLDYASIGPEHAMLHDSGRAEYVSKTMRPRSMPSSSWRAPRASCPRSKAPTPWPRPCALLPRSLPVKYWW